ncbi:hypothetical protein BCF33_2007 [Hasllibacter halocynthiae]|uniref:Uncharacterized protein n=1 Tax=Hasllibacter halocynthiae TaxID=595589 RepID=A0A2T0X2H7_9RHOB|nr:hypothetical protein BCF33_2007 [Hasllibacter halocynthiae]
MRAAAPPGRLARATVAGAHACVAPAQPAPAAGAAGAAGVWPAPAPSG